MKSHFNCSGCQHLERTLVGDSFDRGTKLVCKKAGKVVDAYCDEKDFPPDLPSWCPVLVELMWSVPIDSLT